MAIRTLPGRPTPFVGQKSKTSSTGMRIGAVVFVIVFLGILLAVLYLVPPLMDDIVFPDIGIPFAILFIIFLTISLLVLVVLMVKQGIYTGRRIGIRVIDPSICTRVIRDGYDGEEYIISGGREDTFVQACRNNWQFKTVDQKSKWFIKDERGNDVNNRPLESEDGIFILIPEFGSETQKEEPDESDRYSSIRDSVTYYD